MSEQSQTEPGGSAQAQSSEVVSPDEAVEYLSSVFRDSEHGSVRERQKIMAACGILEYWHGHMTRQLGEALVTIQAALSGQYIAAMEEQAETSSAAPPPTEDRRND